MRGTVNILLHQKIIPTENFVAKVILYGSKDFHVELSDALKPTWELIQEQRT